MGEFSERTLALTQELGYKSLFWSYSYKDWETDKQPGVKESLGKAVDAAHNGAVYLLHSVSETNNKIMPEMIDQIRAKGFEFGVFK